MSIYGTPGLGALTFSYSKEIRMQREQSDLLKKVATEIAALRQESAQRHSSITSSSNEIVFEATGDNAKKMLDVI